MQYRLRNYNEKLEYVSHPFPCPIVDIRYHVHTFTAAPGKPKGPLKVSDVTKGGCKLKWGKPEDDGGKPVTSYQVEKLDKATGRWVPVGRTSDTEMDIKGLQEGHEYEFRVKAINEEGESEPLVTDGSTLAKNPYGKILYRL